MALIFKAKCLKLNKDKSDKVLRMQFNSSG